ncbi:hypothetical protein IWQ60_005908 [Tieghemiomyces parasiticus]|uniref:Uncharacterized protein n=1 Tax=Tieghemiomyces parasiticus TaxID=78921 RepID=A0A9W8ADW4_9FUNG|nr:hypothetical protein IWQ60_005908 [Tieghemiomyces parasiticus]
MVLAYGAWSEILLEYNPKKVIMSDYKEYAAPQENLIKRFPKKVARVNMEAQTDIMLNTGNFACHFTEPLERTYAEEPQLLLTAELLRSSNQTFWMYKLLEQALDRIGLFTYGRVPCYLFIALGGNGPYIQSRVDIEPNKKACDLTVSQFDQITRAVIDAE